VKPRRPENLNRGEVLAFNAKDTAGPGMHRVPGYLKVDASETIRGSWVVILRARRFDTHGFSIAYIPPPHDLANNVIIKYP
jgi:hypothetical protein